MPPITNDQIKEAKGGENPKKTRQNPTELYIDQYRTHPEFMTLTTSI